ncbi:hypothetical protein F5Y08DRAFT_340829 [Xylaria arbuscula]|nr:hypothetical protein F5Y08DRAFT_340829 [Xylaria arbuscula]
MRLSIALCASAVTAASLPAAELTEGIPLAEFGQVNSVSPEEAEAGIDMGYTLLQRGSQEGYPLETFGSVHHVTPEAAKQHVDLGGNNFSVLPIFGPGHESDLDSWLDKQDHGHGHHHGLDELEDRLRHKHGEAITKVEDIIDDFLSTRDIEERDAGDCANPRIRYEWDDYSAAHKKQFTSAIQCLIKKPASGKVSYSKNRYEDLVRIHQAYAPNIHSRSTSAQTHKFLLWHRYYLWAFEQVLREDCGFTAPMPWWDEKKWAGRYAQSTLFTPEYFGTLPGATNGRGTCIYNGAFGGLQSNLGPGSTVNNPHCVQRAVNEQTTAQTGVNAYNTCLARTSYPDFHSCVEFTFHAQGHNGIGATMADAIASPGDPAFFMHHSYVDYVFRKWQLGALSRRNTISGCATNDGCTPLTLDTVIYMGNICKNCPDLPVRDIIRTLQGKFCYKYNY